MYIPIIVLLSTVAFLIYGKVRSDIVALCGLIALVLTGTLTVDDALSGFSNPVVLMMVGLFIVSGALFQTGLAKLISSSLLKVSGGNENLLFVIIMLTTALLGGFVSVLGAVALMLPIVISICQMRGISVRRFLMPLAFVGSMGGMLTLIGTPPNLVIQEALSDTVGEQLRFFSFFPLGIVCVVSGIVILLPLSKYLNKKNKGNSINKNNKTKTLKELVSEYNLDENLYRVKAIPTSKCLGLSVSDLSMRKLYKLSILEIRRSTGLHKKFLNTISQNFVIPETIISEGDVLYIRGELENINEFAAHYNLQILNRTDTEETNEEYINFFNIGIAEILLIPTSTLAGQTVKEINLRGVHNINVLGIRRKKEYILSNLGEEKIRVGDVLLIQGLWKDIDSLSKDTTNWVVLGQPLEQAAKVTLDHKSPVAAAIMALMVASMVFDFIPIEPVTSIMIASIAMILTGCLRNVEAAYKMIDWESVVLIAAMMPFSLAMKKTGVSDLISETLVEYLGGLGPYALMAGIYLTTAVVTNFISNTATAIILAPIAIHCAAQIGCSPVPFLFAVTYGACMCFILPFSTPPNAMVMSVGQYNTSDYIKIGLPLQILLGVIMVIVIPLIWKF